MYESKLQRLRAMSDAAPGEELVSPLAERIREKGKRLEEEIESDPRKAVNGRIDNIYRGCKLIAAGGIAIAGFPFLCNFLVNNVEVQNHVYLYSAIGAAGGLGAVVAGAIDLAKNSSELREICLHYVRRSEE